MTMLMKRNPQGWPLAKVNQVATVIMGQAPKGDTYNENKSGIPLIAGASDLGVTTPAPKRYTDAPTKICAADDILLCVRATIGDLNWADGIYCLGRGIAALRAGSALDRHFFYYWLAANKRSLLAKGRGATFKQISKKDIGELMVPVPQMEEQRRIVRQINDLVCRIDEIKKDNRGRLQDLEDLKKVLVLGESPASRQIVRVGTAVRWVRATEIVRPGLEYHFAGVRSFGKGMFESATRTSSEFKYGRLRRLRAGQFVYPKLMAWEGGFAMVPERFDGFVLSPEFVVFEADESVLLPEVLDTYFRTPLCLPQVRGGSTGSNMRRRRLNPREFLNLSIPLPPMRIQQQLREVYRFETDVLKDWTDMEDQLAYLNSSILRRAFAGEL